MAWDPLQLREWHEQLMDLLLLNPRATYEELAQQVGSHPVTVGMVVRSDLFQARLRERREARQSKVDESVLVKLERLAGRSIDGLSERIEKEKSLLGISEVRETAEMALRGLGYIGSGSAQAPRPTTPVNLQVVVVNRDDLAEARKLMRLSGPLPVASGE